MSRVEFTAKSFLLFTLLILGLLVLLLSLGFWQLDRARQKETMQTLFEQNLQGAVTGLADLDVSDPANQFRQVMAKGFYDGSHQLLLDNQIVDGQVGVHVYTPLRLLNNPEQAILINRGWMPLAPGRQSLPALPVPSEAQSITGRLSKPANPALHLGEATPEHWPGRVSFINYQALTEALPYGLLPAVILLAPETEYGFQRLWRPTFGGIGPERHRGYAVQWFALALTLLVLYLLTIIRSWRQQPQ